VCQILGETRRLLENLPPKKRKKIDWTLFRKWEREAEMRYESQKEGERAADSLIALQTKKRKQELDDIQPPPISRPPPYRAAAADTEEGEVRPALGDGGSAGQLQEKEEVEMEGESSDEDKSEEGGIYREVRKLLDEAMTPELKTPLKRVFKSVKRKAAEKPPLQHPMKTRAISVTEKRPKEAYNLPMLQFPGADGPVWLERPWDLEELLNVTAALPNPEKGVERFIAAVTNVDVTYKPTGRDWAAIFSGKMGLKWTEICGTPPAAAFNPTLPRLDEGGTETQEWRNQWTAMVERLRLAFPIKPDWAAITNTKQLKGETVSAYLARLKTVVDECAGLPEGTDNSGVLKHHFVNGLLPNIQGAVRLTCIAWEAQDLEVVMQHAKHAEHNDEKKNTEKENKLQTAQYMFYQSQSNNQPSRNSRWDQQQEREIRIKTAGRCRICGQRGHWARSCQNYSPQQRQPQQRYPQQQQQQRHPQQESYQARKQNYREQRASSFHPPPPTPYRTA